MGAKKSKKPVKKGKSFRLVVTLIALSCCAAIGYFVYLGTLWMIDNKLPAFRTPGIVYVRSETTYREFLDDLMKLDPYHPSSIERVMAKEDLSSNFKPGLYRITQSTSARYLARAVTRGWQNPTKLTISGSIRNKQVLAQKIASQMMVDSATVVNALDDSFFLTGYDTTPSKVFEIIIPDTYEVYWAEDMHKIMHRLKMARDAYWTQDRVDLARKQGLSPEQVHILASIIAEESNRQDEYPKIARVYINRLKKGMPLQACPTVRYIYGYKINRVLYTHLKNPSPYNTYIHTGLPPTPICLPSKAHLEAVLHPSDEDYLYFCADAEMNGTNVFSKTFSEHRAKASAYQAALDRAEALKRSGNGANL